MGVRLWPGGAVRLRYWPADVSFPNQIFAVTICSVALDVGLWSMSTVVDLVAVSKRFLRAAVWLRAHIAR